MSSNKKAYSKVSVAEEDEASTSTTTTALSETATTTTTPNAMLHETLIAVPSATVTASSTPMLQVTAPANLPEGYEMEAVIGGGNNGSNPDNYGDKSGTVIKVQVPPGGIEQGQTFSVPLPSHVESRFLSASIIRVPVGQWRDGFFEFYKYGVCHPHCWTACCCTTLAAGQVMSRLGLDWTGKPAQTTGRAAAAFTVIMGIVILYYVIRVPLAISFWIVADDDQPDDEEEEFNDGGANNNNNFDGDDDDDGDGDPDGDFVSMLILIWFCFFWLIMAIILTRVRSAVRERYGIAPTYLGDTLEDPAVSCCCCCFAAGQMLRHTTEYETYPATCCTRTGIPATAPSIS